MTKRRMLSLLLVSGLVAPALAGAALKDVGAVNATTGFPQWYRDTNNLAVQLCTSQTPSPNAAAGGAPMCFPLVTDPAGYPGNLGGEIFYYNASASITGAGGFSVLWEGAIEATYATGVPIRGDEITFARIRIVMDTRVAGTYRVIHPYGVETFPGVTAGKRSVFFTVDIGVAPGVFTGALAGAVGPFMQWDVLAPGESLTLTDPITGAVQQFLGDPNYFHTATGSPFGTNFLRIEGPAGSNLDGLGNDFVQTNLFAILGTKYSVPIPQQLSIGRATYGLTTAGAAIDVYATSVPGARLLLTGADAPSTVMPGNGTGAFFSHVDFVPNLDPVSGVPLLPPEVTVTNLSDNPHSKQVAPLVDEVVIKEAVFDPATSTLSVTAVTSDQVNAPAMSILQMPGVLGTPVGNAWTQQFVATIPPGALPPWQATAVSPRGGRHSEPMTFLATTLYQQYGPTVLNVPATTGGCVVVTGCLPLNIPLVNPLVYPTWMVLNPPAKGSVVQNPDGSVSYTPAVGFVGVDTFTYVVQDAATQLFSNAGTVSVDVTIQNGAPVANPDFATTTAGAARIISVLANDVDVDGFLVRSSVLIAAPPIFGQAIVNIDGTVTYVPNPGFVGTDTFLYTVADNLGAVSNTALVTVTVSAQAETLAIIRAEYIASKNRFRVSGTSSLFGPGIANTVTLYYGAAGGPIVGTALIDALGAWIVDVVPSPLVPAAGSSVTAVSTGGGSATARVVFK